MKPTNDPGHISEQDYRLWEDFLKEETEKYGWEKVSSGIYRRRGVMLKIVKRVGKGFQVVSFLEHPVHGNTALVRDRLNRQEMVDILRNPRVHTDKGWIPNSPRRRLNSLFNQIQQNAELANTAPIFHDTITETKGRRKSNINSMKPLADIIVEAQALATVAEDQFESALAAVVADLQAYAPATDPVVSVSITTQNGVVSEFVPKV